MMEALKGFVGSSRAALNWNKNLGEKRFQGFSYCFVWSKTSSHTLKGVFGMIGEKLSLDAKFSANKLSYSGEYDWQEAVFMIRHVCLLGKSRMKKSYLCFFIVGPSNISTVSDDDDRNSLSCTSDDTSNGVFGFRSILRNIQKLAPIHSIRP